MNFLLLLFLLLLINIPALISVNAVTSTTQLGIQSSNPLVFLFQNNQFEFGPLKVSFEGTNENLGSFFRVFLGYFSSVLDIQPSSGEISDVDFAKKLDSTAKDLLYLFQEPSIHPFLFEKFLTTENQNFIQQNHQQLKTYFISFKPQITEMARAKTLIRNPSNFTFEGLTPSQGETYTELLIMFTAMSASKLLPSWDPDLLVTCKLVPKCVADAIKKNRPTNEIKPSPGSTFQTSPFGNNSATRLLQAGPPYFFFIVGSFFVFGYVFLM
ncbi:hypothetical protein HMI54_012029 [Coelomomyces lativittatus]|nr:hypothetical protein HMI54_012029 [Coelomomyces lativittatus]KAJ1499204.1 hypothetical protein HMI56_004527 [Coelomomyces lativittatus]KAJ1504834.1 hypothetical protein HMI55_001848 [Coelomomyces lativittatus]